MVHRIEVASVIPDTRADVVKRILPGVTKVELLDVYTIDAPLDERQLGAAASLLTNPVTQTVTPQSGQFNWAIEIGFLPGVTDNVGATAREGLVDLLGTDAPVHSSQVYFISGDFDRNQVRQLSTRLANPLIERISIKHADEYAQGGMGVIVPRVTLTTTGQADIVDILGMGDEALTILGKKGIPNKDGSRRGPLALDLTYLHAIQAYFQGKGRNPTDIELESIAQTWSEHCKHTIFADPIDEITEGLYRTFIKGATKKIRQQKGNKDFCVSVFTDNSGAIIFDSNYLITDKAETHNSPSALDPFGGSITGIVGVNRDAIGFGLGAKPIINRYGYCFADPTDEVPLYKGPAFTQQMLSPRMIMDGVIEGVNVGGNCSGIPTPQGFVIFDKRYKGKPLVYVGTLGLIPRDARELHTKKANPGDYVVMVGGRVGKDGIHGATFSSEAMDSGSPATAVQIGDPITQKKLSDALVKEARDLGLYTSITDNGAGGLSCSVAEMAKESGGCHVDLDSVPVKYPGLAPWEIWISESQERMTLAVPPDKWDEFSDLMSRRGVEATVIGEFTDSGTCTVDYDGKEVMNLDMGFLHDGLPPRPMTTTYTRPTHGEPDFEPPGDLTQSLHAMLSRLTITSFEFISEQYDHEVQGGSVIKPLQGRGRVNGDATVTKPVLSSPRGVVISQGINPSYSDIDTYHMAASAIDTAIRNAIAVGANLDHLALMDNFCWCSSNEPERLGQLKAAVEACYDYALAYGTPFISGKDSMFNDFKGFDHEGKPVKISVPPTLLISSVSVMEDATKAVSLDAKMAGDLVYVLGSTKEELGGSEYFAMVGEERGESYIGNGVPHVDAEVNAQVYSQLSEAIQEEIVASAQSVHRGGLAVALAKTAIGGKLGMHVTLDSLPGNCSRDDFTLYSESQGRLVVTIAPENQQRFEELMHGLPHAAIGSVLADSTFTIKGATGMVVDTTLDTLLSSYKSTFKGY